jgi:TonB family protein
MLDENSLAPKPSRALEHSPPPASYDPKQRGLMVGALCLLLLALGIVLWHDRDFWFPDAPDEDSTEAENAPVPIMIPIEQPAALHAEARTEPSPRRAGPRKHRRVPATVETAVVAPAQTSLAAESDAPAGAIITRTVLPPLEVEVIAGDTRHKIRPGSNSVHVEMEPGAPAQPTIDATPVSASETAAEVTSDAAERVQMSADTSQAVAKPVKPSYPLLARQMKVQGSVILQALVGRDGVIQNLRVMSGPPILATAAQDAVRQWHFKPHLEGGEAVETEAKITVNFTISTN